MDSRQRLAATTAIDGSNTTIAVLGSQQSTDIGPDDRLSNSESSTPAASTNLDPLPTASDTSNQQLEDAAAPTAHLDADAGANQSTSTSTHRQAVDLIPDETDNSDSGRDQNGSTNLLQADSERELREPRNRISQYGSSIRVSGTHEEVERQGSNYVSPVAQPFTNTSRSIPDTIAQLPNPSASTQQAGPRRQIVPELISRRSTTFALLLSGLEAAQRSAEELERTRRLNQDMTPFSNTDRDLTNPTHTQRTSEPWGLGPALISPADMERNNQQTNVIAESGPANVRATSENRQTGGIQFSPAPPDSDFPLGRMLTQEHLSEDHPGHGQQPIDPTMAQSNEPVQEMERLLLEASRTGSLNNDPLPSEMRDDSILARANPFSSGLGIEALDGSRVQRSNNSFIRGGPTRTRPAARRTNRDSLENILRLTSLFAGDSSRRRRSRAAQPSVGLDVQEPRPPGLTREEMTVERGCKICMDQLATIALIPCGMVASLVPAYN